MASDKQKQAWDRYFAKVERRKKMLELYHKGLIDREIAAEAGVSTPTVTHWRHYNNLPSNGVGCGFAGRGGGVPMEEILDPNQCEVMRQFLGCLLALQDEYPDRKIDVGVFMKEYRRGLQEKVG
ncbi:MAG: helix-turn-helix domain containing protein [Syntrophomonas sp.]|nr:helix-turn-helix domain containing protein [Syntrophomonas sp.]